MAKGPRQHTEEELELRFVRQLEELGWVYREDIRDGEGLEENFFQLLGARLQHRLTASERQRGARGQWALEAGWELEGRQTPGLWAPTHGLGH